MKNIKNFIQFINEGDGSTTGTVGSGTAVGGGASGSFTTSAGVSISGGDSASSGSVGSSGTAYATLGNTSGMGPIRAAQPSGIPGDVAGSTKGSGDISKGFLGPFTKSGATKKKKTYAEKGAQIDKFYVSQYKEKANKGGRMISTWKTFK